MEAIRDDLGLGSTSSTALMKPSQRSVHTSLIISRNRCGMVLRKSISVCFSRPLSTANTMNLPCSSCALTSVTKSEWPLRSEISSTPRRPRAFLTPIDFALDVAFEYPAHDIISNAVLLGDVLKCAIDQFE